MVLSDQSNLYLKKKSVEHFGLNLMLDILPNVIQQKYSDSDFSHLLIA